MQLEERKVAGFQVCCFLFTAGINITTKKNSAYMTGKSLKDFLLKRLGYASEIAVSGTS